MRKMRRPARGESGWFAWLDMGVGYRARGLRVVTRGSLQVIDMNGAGVVSEKSAPRGGGGYLEGRGGGNSLVVGSACVRGG